jgi:thioredoxin-like negative regulator of GroEL
MMPPRNQLIRLYAWQDCPIAVRLLESAMAGTDEAERRESPIAGPVVGRAREWPKAVDSWQMLAREHAHPKAAMRAAELLLQQGKTDAAMTQLAAIKSVKGEQGNRAKALLVQAHLNKEQYAQALVLAASCNSRTTGKTGRPAGSTYIQAQTDGMNKSGVKLG